MSSSFRLLPLSSYPTIDKDPDADLRYGIDVQRLLQADDSISTAVVSASAGVTVGAAFTEGTIVGARVSGGTAGQVGSMTLRWTTEQGDTDERTLGFRILQR